VPIDHAPEHIQFMSYCPCCCHGFNCEGNRHPHALSVTLDLSRICPALGSFTGDICLQAIPGCCEGTGGASGASACFCYYLGSFDDPDPGSGNPYVTGISLSCVFEGAVLNCPHNPSANCVWTLAIGLGCTTSGPFCPPDCPPCSGAELQTACGNDGCVDLSGAVLGAGLYFGLDNCTDADDVNHPGWMKGCNPENPAPSDPGRNDDVSSFFLHAPTLTACLGDFAEVSCSEGGCTMPEPGPCDAVCAGCGICESCIPCYGCMTDPSDPVLCPDPAGCTGCVDCEFCIPCLDCLNAHMAMMARRPVMGRPRIPKPPAPTQATAGVGTEFKKLSSALGIPPCRQCDEEAAEMDRNGIEWCRLHADEIAARIQERSDKLGWGRWLTAGVRATVSGLPKTISGLLQLAITRAEAK
jgi:hypothetical protein